MSEVQQPELRANLLVASIVLGTANGERHLPVEEHILRRRGQPNLHTYKIPFMECEVRTFVQNVGGVSVSLLQRCVPTHGACLKVVVAPAGGEVELPLRRELRDKCAGFDVLDGQSKQKLLELRFLYAPASDVIVALETGAPTNAEVTAVLAKMRGVIGAGPAPIL